MEKVRIVCDSIGSEELFELLHEQVPNTDDLKLEKEEEPENTMGLDPVTLVALISMSSAVLTAIINGLFGVWQKKIDNKGKSETAVIKVKTQDGDFEIPRNISQAELDKTLAEIEKRKIKRVALITKL